MANAEREEPEGAKDLWKVPPLRKSEIGGLRQHFLDDFHKRLGKHKTLSTLTTRSGRGVIKWGTLKSGQQNALA